MSGLRALAQALGDRLHLLDGQGVTLDANPAACAALGLAPRQVRGRRWHDLGVPSGSAGLLDHAVGEVMGDGRTRFVEVELPVPDGSRPFACRLDPVRKADAVIAVALSAREIATARTPTPPAAEELDGILDALDGGSWAWNIRHGTVVWSSRLYQLLGADPARHASSLAAFLSFVHPDDRARVIACVSEAVSSRRERLEQSFRVVRPDGEVRHILSRARLVLDAVGQPERLLGVDVDVTAARRAEAALEASEERLRLALRCAPVVLFEQDRELRYRWVHNPAPDIPLERILGRTDAELIGEAAAAPLAAAKRRILAGAHVATELPVAFPDCVRVFDFHGEPVRDPAGAVTGLRAAAVDISQRRRAEAALRESEALLRQIAETIDDVVWISEPDAHRLVYVNPAYERIWGRSVAALRADYGQWLGAVHPEDRELVRARFFGPLPEGGIEIEYRVVRPDGEVRWILDRGRPVPRAAGEARRLAGVAVDITARKAMEQALRLSEERFRLAAKATKGIVYDVDLASERVVEVRGLAEVIGIRPNPEGYAVDWWTARIHPDDVGRLLALRQRVRDGSDSHLSIEYRVRHADGSWVHLLDRSFAVRDEAGRAVRRVGVSTEITAQKLAEAALRRSEERFRLVLAHSPIALFTQDRDLRYTWVYNPLIDAAPADLIGRTEADLVPPEAAAPLQAIKRRVMATGCAERHEISYPGRTRGRLVADLYVEPLRDAEGAIVGVSGAAVDVTARHRTEAERARLATIVEQSPDVIGSADPEGRLTYLNAAARRLLRLEGEGVPAGLGIPDFHPAWATELIMQTGIPAALHDGAWLGETALLDHDGREIPTSQMIVANRAPDGRLLGLSAIFRDIRERKEAEARLQLLTRELNHRVKNILALVQAIANQTAAGTDDQELFMALFRGRLAALAAAQDLLIQSGWRDASLQSLTRAVLAPLQPAEGGRVRIDLEDQTLSPSAAQTLALVLHELATNAVKHGALSTASGTIELRMRKGGHGAGRWLEMLWEEAGGPPVRRPGRKGFGMTLLERLLRLQHKGEAKLDWRRSGLRCRIHLPLEEIDAALGGARSPLR